MSNPQRFLRLHWVDQITSEPKNTADFYADLLGFKSCGIDESGGHTSYSMQDEEGGDIFGIVEEAVFPDWLQGWIAYFEVEDFETQCDRIEALGGEIISRRKHQCLFKDPAGSPTVLVRSDAAKQ